VSRALIRKTRTVFETKSGISGRIRVLEDSRERRLVVAGDTLSTYPLNGDWSRIEREYWWKALEGVDVPPRPSVLMVGLGGGTQIHLLRRISKPRRITVIERDAAIVEIAREWFGLDAVPGLELCCGDAAVILPGLARLDRRFDFIMEDAAYGLEVDGAIDLARALAALVSPRGTLVLNRHWRHDAKAVRDTLASWFREISMRRVKREGENVLIYCARPVATVRPGRAPVRRR
jgi:spermidine synthase